MNLFRRTHRLLLTVSLLVAGLGWERGYSFIQYEAYLIDPPPVVSLYEPRFQAILAAHPPAVYPPINPVLSFTPKSTVSFYDQSYIRFTTDYGLGKQLVPVAVDALKYDDFRRRNDVKRRFATFSQKSIALSKKQTGPGGVSVGLALPRQLESVFGEGGGNLRVSGYRRISFSGRSQWTDAAQSDVLRQSKFPTLNMDQVYRFDIEGTIGSKISVKVAEDSQTDIPLSNRIQIRYKGSDDDILKTIEAGNTNLSLPGAQFVGYSSRIQGLFGIKTEAKVGKFSMTAIASQEKGSSERASISASGEEKAQSIRDWQFAVNRIFDLSLATDSLPFGRKDVVKNVLVYEQAYGSDINNRRFAKMYVDPKRDNDRSPNAQAPIKIIQLPVEQYSFYSDTISGRHYVVFNTRRSDNSFGVFIDIERLDTLTGRRVRDTVGNITDFGDTLILKMLRPVNGYTPRHPSWPLMWRNIYEVPKGVSIEDLNIRIFKGAAGTEDAGYNLEYDEKNGIAGKPYLQLLGIDRFNKQDQPVPDGLVDDRQEVFRSDWGLLLFPDREPFASSVLEEPTSKIYASESDDELVQSSAYYIQMATRTRSSMINLNRVNIIEGSERVTVNGVQLNRGSDYTIDYSFGRLTLLSAAATDPNAKVNVDFEYAPFLAIQKKTLIGVRGDYQFNKDFHIGSTWLYKSDKAQDRKPRVGQETARMTVFDVDGGLRLYPRFLTKLANALPFVATDAPSSLNLSGEVAQSRPNPNVDGSAYIDDFESAFEMLNLGMTRTSWLPSSPPDKVLSMLDKAPWTAILHAGPSSRADSIRGKVLWHSAPAISINDVYKRDIGQGETGALNPFRIVFRPRTIRIDTTGGRTDTVRVPSWGGITSLLNGVDAYRAKLFEIRAKGKRGILHFDFGKISEDINGDGILNQEADDYKTMLRDLDVGLDGKSDAAEGATAQNPDPAGDNWYSGQSGKCPLPNNACVQEPYKTRFNDPEDSLFYEYLNGTEGNFDDAVHLGMPDRESFSQYSPFNTSNSYFSYKIDLADLSSDSSRYVLGSDLNGWRTYRIPIMDPAARDTTVGSATLAPNWSEITHVRVWWEADSTQTEPDTVQIAAWYIVQSNWQDTLVLNRQSDGNTRFVVASVSEEDGTYSAPTGVEAYKDKTTGATEARRALSLRYERIVGGSAAVKADTCLVYKRLPTIDRYSGYRRLQMYVHGDTDTANAGKIQLFLRLGRDEGNFYEYHTDVDTGWAPRNFIDMDFNVATALKNAAQKALTPGGSNAKIDTTEGNYRVVGDPNINEVRFFAVGVVNKDGDKERSGTIWLDELRVSDVRRDVGTAARFDINGKVADLLDYSFGWRSQNPYFRGVSATTRGGSQDNLGSGSTDRGYNYNLSLSFHKFLPRSWNASIPVGFSYNKTTQIPVLRTASDIVLPSEVRQQEKSESVTKSFRVSESFDKKGSNPLFSVLLNRQKLSFSYVRTQSLSVNRPYSFGESFSVGGQFSMTVTKAPSIPLFSWANSIPILKKTKGTRLWLYPTRWDWSFGFDRSVNVSEDISRKRTSSFSRGLDGRMGMEYKVFDNLNFRLDLNTKRDLSDPTQVSWSLKRFKPGLETNFSQTFSATYAPRVFGWFGTGFSYSANYGDSYERSTKTRGSSLSRSWGVSGDFKHLVLFGKRDRGGTGQPDVPRGQGAKDGKGKETQKVGPSRPIYDLPFALARFLTGWFDPITYRFAQTYNSSLPGMARRPGLQYRFGLQDKADVTLIGDSRTPVATRGETLELGSRFRLLGGIVTDVKYRRGSSRDLARQGSASKRVSTVWPDLDITISKFSVLPFIKGPVNKFIDIFRPRTGFTRETKQSIDVQKGWAIDKSISSDYNPLLAIEFRLFRALSMSAAYTLQKSQMQQFNPAKGTLSTEQHASQRGITVTSRYSFRSPGGIKIPIFGKLKISSLMNIEVSVRKNSTTNRSWSPSQGWYEESKSDFMVSPNISYEFSQAIKGGLSGIWQDISDTKTTSHVRMLQIFAEVRF